MDIINSSPHQPRQHQPEPAPEIEQPESTTQVHEPVVGHVHHRSKKKAFLRIFLTLIIAALAAAGVYYWQQGEISDLQSQLDAKTAENATLQQQATVNARETTEDTSTTTIPPSTISEDLIAGDVDTDRTDGKVMVGAIFKYSLAPSAIWVEYGTTPEKLDKATSKNTKGLGEGSPEAIYSTGENFFINNAQLTPGATYYYRTAATVNGKTLYSGVASFVTKK